MCGVCLSLFFSPVDEPRQEHHGSHDARGVPREEHGDHHAVVVRLGVPLVPPRGRVQNEPHGVEPRTLQPHGETPEQVRPDDDEAIVVDRLSFSTGCSGFKFRA